MGEEVVMANFMFPLGGAQEAHQSLAGLIQKILARKFVRR